MSLWSDVPTLRPYQCQQSRLNQDWIWPSFTWLFITNKSLVAELFFSLDYSYNPKPEVSKTPKYLTTYLPKKSQNNYFILNCLCTFVQSSSFEMFAVRLVWVCVQIYRSQHVLSVWSECFSCSHRRLLCCLLYICPHIELLFILLEVQCVLYSVFILQFLQRFPSHLFAKAHTSYIMQSDAWYMNC